MLFAIACFLLVGAVGLSWLRSSNTATTRLAVTALIVAGAAALILFHPARAPRAELETDVQTYCAAFGKRHEDLWREWTNVLGLSPEAKVDRWLPYQSFVWLAADLCLKGPENTCADRAFSGIPETLDREVAQMVAAFKESKPCAIE